MKLLLKTCLFSIVAMGLLTGCVVYEPRPRGYVIYDSPAVVVVHEPGFPIWNSADERRQ
jgi:hypothetical protein